jgi:hypothetical protein
MRDKSGLIHLKIASPCPARWEEMEGDDRTRFCEQCELNVFNISEMTEREALDLVASHTGRLCVRLYQRADGRVLTRDCPVGLAAVRRRIARTAALTVVVVLGIFTTALGSIRGERRDFREEMERVRKVPWIDRICRLWDPAPEMGDPNIEMGRYAPEVLGKVVVGVLPVSVEPDESEASP